MFIFSSLAHVISLSPLYFRLSKRTLTFLFHMANVNPAVYLHVHWSLRERRLVHPVVTNVNERTNFNLEQSGQMHKVHTSKSLPMAKPRCWTNACLCTPTHKHARLCLCVVRWGLVYMPVDTSTMWQQPTSLTLFPSLFPSAHPFWPTIVCLFLGLSD